MEYILYKVDPKLCYPIDVRKTPDLDATSSCDGPEGALAVSQFLGIGPRQHRLDLFTRGATERACFSTLAIYIHSIKLPLRQTHWPPQD